MTVLRYGDTAARLVSQRVAAPVANIAALAAIGLADAADGQTAVDIATGKKWRFSAASVVTADNQLVAGAGTAGRWLLLPGAHDLSFAITFNTADAAILWTVPTGAYVRVLGAYWEVTADWTGGASSSIGLSSSQTVGVDHSTKGDLFAAALAAALTATIGVSEGTIGADIAAGVILRPASTVRFDRIVSAFTAGTGNAHLTVQVLKNAGV